MMRPHCRFRRMRLSAYVRFGFSVDVAFVVFYSDISRDLVGVCMTKNGKFGDTELS